MALPISPPPKSDDVAIHGWAGITVRVAWTLLTLGVKVRREVLEAARTHVLLHLSPATPLPLAEDRAAHLTERFVAMARGKRHDDPWPGDAEMPLTERWVRAIESLRDRTTQGVFRMHYGDNRSLRHIQQRLDLDPVAVDAAQEGLREVLRRVAKDDGLPLDSWPAARLDRVLKRLASWAPDSCPPTYDVINGAHRTHVRACTRCNRMVRLMHAGTLELEDVLAPTMKARPTGKLKLLVLHLHPDARLHRAGLKKALPGEVTSAGDDVLYLPLTDAEPVHEVLKLAAELRRPERHLLRGAVVQGPGAWSRFGPLGPLGRKGAIEVGNRPWGVVDGLGALPEALPEPPSATFAWLAVGGLAAAAAATMWFATLGNSSFTPTEWVEFVPTDDAVLARFDVPDENAVAVVTMERGQAHVRLPGRSPTDKAALAVGDGSFVVELPPTDAVLFTMDDGPFELDPLLAQAMGSPDPVQALVDAVRRSHPDARAFSYDPRR